MGIDDESIFNAVNLPSFIFGKITSFRVTISDRQYP
jgi:hypothetical protein